MRQKLNSITRYPPILINCLPFDSFVHFIYKFSLYFFFVCSFESQQMQKQKDMIYVDSSILLLFLPSNEKTKTKKRYETILLLLR